MSRIRTWWGGRSRRTKAIIIGVVAVLAIGSASSAPPNPGSEKSGIAALPSTAAPSPTSRALEPTPTLTAAPPDTPTIAATVTPTPAITPSPTPEPTPAPTPKATPVPAILKTSGRGDKIVKFTAQDTPTYARINAKSGGNFAVISYAGSEYGDLLVNTIGSYGGYVYIAPGMDRLKVTAGSSWAIEVHAITSAKYWDGSSPLTAKGDYVVNLTDSAFGITTIENTGQSNFAVIAYSQEGEYLDLLVNDIGSYSGEVMLPLADPMVLSIHSVGGTWSFSAVDQ